MAHKSTLSIYKGSKGGSRNSTVIGSLAAGERAGDGPPTAEKDKGFLGDSAFLADRGCLGRVGIAGLQLTRRGPSV